MKTKIKNRANVLTLLSIHQSFIQPIKKERIGKNMELKFSGFPTENIRQFRICCREDKVVQRRINGRLTVLSRKLAILL